MNIVTALYQLFDRNYNGDLLWLFQKLIGNRDGVGSNLYTTLIFQISLKQWGILPSLRVWQTTGGGDVWSIGIEAAFLCLAFNIIVAKSDYEDSLYNKGEV